MDQPTTTTTQTGFCIYKNIPPTLDIVKNPLTNIGLSARQLYHNKHVAPDEDLHSISGLLQYQARQKERQGQDQNQNPQRSSVACSDLESVEGMLESLSKGEFREWNPSHDPLQRRIQWPYRDLEVGECFILPKRLRTGTSTYRKMLSRNFIGRESAITELPSRVFQEPVILIWRLSDQAQITKGNPGKIYKSLLNAPAHTNTNTSTAEVDAKEVEVDPNASPTPEMKMQEAKDTWAELQRMNTSLEQFKGQSIPREMPIAVKLSHLYVDLVVEIMQLIFPEYEITTPTAEGNVLSVRNRE